MIESENSSNSFDYEVDAVNLKCPMPLLKMKQALNKAKVGETILIKASDPASQRDFKSFVEIAHHQMISKIEDKIFLYWITKLN